MAVEELTKTLAEKAAQVHISMTSGMLNPTNPGIDFMQLIKLIEPNSGLSYADDISRQHDERVRQALDLVTADPTKLDALFLNNLFTELHQCRMGVLDHVSNMQKTELEKID